MIVKMKKVVILLAERHRDSALKKLRKLGVLHVQPVQIPASDDIQSLENKMELIDRALKIIPAEAEKEKKFSVEKSESAIEKILSLNQEKERLSAEKAELLPMRDWFEKWGAISGESLAVLKEHGIFVRFYQADKKALKEIPKDKIIHIAHEEQGTIYLALFGKDEDDRLDLREVQIPAMEFVEIESRLADIEAKQNKIEKELNEFAEIRGALIEYHQYLEKQLEISRAKYGMGEVGEIVYLQGFCPIETVEKVAKLAEKEGWGYLIDDPDDPAEVPTLLRNPKWVEIIKPLFDFMGTLPGYNEKDVSLVFLAFFSVFYAMIVGDAGYGMIFLLGTLYFDLKTKSKGVRPVYDNIPIIMLKEGESLRLEGVAKLGLPRRHQKFQAGLASYDYKDPKEITFTVESYHNYPMAHDLVKIAIKLIKGKIKDCMKSIEKV